MTTRRGAVLRLLGGVTAFLCVAATPVEDRKLRFKCEIPDGFGVSPIDETEDNVLLAFRRLEPNPRKVSTVIRISRMRGTLNQEKKRTSITGPNGEIATIRYERWKEYEIPVTLMLMPLPSRQGQFAYFAALVPLMPEGIMIDISGPDTDQAELFAILQKVLASLDGECSWPTDTAREDAAGRKAGWIICALALIGLVVYLTRRSNRPTVPPGPVDSDPISDTPPTEEDLGVTSEGQSAVQEQMPAPASSDLEPSAALVTVAAFPLPAQADIARNTLTAAGISAVTGDGEIVAMDWLLGNAVGGVKVLVRAGDAARAAEVLRGDLGAGVGPPAAVDEEELARQALAADTDTNEVSVAANQQELPRLHEAAATQPQCMRDEYARRLYLTAVFSLAFLPLGFYALYLLLNAAFGSGPLSPKGRRHLAIGATLVVAGLLFAFLLLTPFGMSILLSLTSAID